DCDVIQADGGTRTASITGAWVALHDCIEVMRARGLVSGDVLTDQVAAISCGIYNGVPVADLDYAEDSVADTDANFVMTGSGDIVEIQATAESVAFDEAAFMELMRLARQSIEALVVQQKQAVAQ
ncbi:MAG TPA: ribonuclease PH, partial [Rhodobiaceae bacterium]|nr:ribonuclease PH [Rhodobiaceae bacterium]